MTHKLVRFFLVSILFAFAFVSCSDDDDDWQQINALSPDANVAAQLDAIISADNECLIMTNNTRQIKLIYAAASFSSLDNCNDVPNIDFENSTLVVGKIEVISMSDNIGSINLSRLGNSYQMDVKLERCAECEGGSGFKYFWKLYPKLEMGTVPNLTVN